MKIHRLVPKKYKSTCWNGYPQGVLIAENRWNPAGTNLLYASESIALSFVEIAIHVGINRISGNYCHGVAEIKEDFILDIHDTGFRIPNNWQMDQTWSRDVGKQFVEEQWDVALKVPSVIFEDSFNYLVNPLHPSFQELDTELRDHFIMDERIK